LGELTGQVITACGHHLDIDDGQKIREEILKIFDQTFAVTSVLLLIALCVATLGIATTLAIVVLERSRQWHIIFAVGGTLRQIRSMILWEAFQMVLVGETAGVLCGFFLSYILVFVINRQSFGWTFVYQVDWNVLVWSLPLILLTAFIAAIPAMGLVFKKTPATILRG
jgi:putative ABC transport system permease protein